jgi:hypothetical protein
LKKVEVIKANKVEVKPFILDDFIQDKVQQSMMDKVTKKELKKLANELGLVYDDAQIAFTKTLLNAYILGK